MRWSVTLATWPDGISLRRVDSPSATPGLKTGSTIFLEMGDGSGDDTGLDLTVDFETGRPHSRDNVPISVFAGCPTSRSREYTWGRYGDLAQRLLWFCTVTGVLDDAVPRRRDRLYLLDMRGPRSLVIPRFMPELPVPWFRRLEGEPWPNASDKDWTDLVAATVPGLVPKVLDLGEPWLSGAKRLGAVYAFTILGPLQWDPASPAGPDRHPLAMLASGVRVNITSDGFAASVLSDSGQGENWDYRFPPSRGSTLGEALENLVRREGYLPQSEEASWWAQNLVPGEVTAPEELEACRLLSLPPPHLWSPERFVDWARESGLLQ